MNTTANLIRNTIFDDVYLTMGEKMPQLMIPLINEVFHTSYSDNEKITHYYNEHHSRNGKIVTDSCFGICDRIYHIECQSNPDSIMIIRMIEYDFAIALENIQKGDDNIFEMQFPHSCVIYLRHNDSTPEKIYMRLILPDGKKYIYITFPSSKYKNTQRMKYSKRSYCFFYRST